MDTITCLLVGRGEPNRAMLEEVLYAQGQEVLVAEDAATAQAVFHEERPPLIILAQLDDEAKALCRRIRGGQRGEEPIIMAVTDGAPNVSDTGIDELIFTCEEFDQMWAQLALVEERVRRRANRTHVEAALRESEAKARAVLETTVDGIITIDEEGRIESFNRAAEDIFGYVEGEVLGENISILMPEPYRSEHDSYLNSYRETGRRQIIGIGREVEGRRKDGAVFPLDLAVSEVQLNGRRLFTGIVRNISERRRLEREILEASEKERRRIGHDLHDNLGQQLTGIGLLSRGLPRKLKDRALPEAEDAAEIEQLIKEADEQARGLARGLVPVELEAHGLVAALRRLAGHTERLFGVRCTFQEAGTGTVHDNTAAMHLYRIAQEAVNNAVKHGEASHIAIMLATGRRRLRLRVKDNGVGFPEEEAHVHESQASGMGVRIMHYRARLIDASLEIWSTPGEGRPLPVRRVLRRAVAPLTTDALSSASAYGPGRNGETLQVISPSM